MYILNICICIYIYIYTYQCIFLFVCVCYWYVTARDCELQWVLCQGHVKHIVNRCKLWVQHGMKYLQEISRHGQSLLLGGQRHGDPLISWYKTRIPSENFLWINGAVVAGTGGKPHSEHDRFVKCLEGKTWINSWINF